VLEGGRVASRFWSLGLTFSSFCPCLLRPAQVQKKNVDFGPEFSVLSASHGRVLHRSAFSPQLLSLLSSGKFVSGIIPTLFFLSTLFFFNFTVIIIVRVKPL
jgi:hypothetical protein